jgi:uncharacterized protein
VNGPVQRRPLPSDVVCNTGPIIAFRRINQLDLLQNIIPSVRVPSAVEREVRAGLDEGDAVLDAWLKRAMVHDPSAPPDAFLAGELDAGEASVIALANELQIGVLMDERKGRRVAALAYGLTVIGTGRILIEAKERGFVSEIRPLMDKLRETGYYISDRLFQSLCRAAGEH